MSHRPPTTLQPKTIAACATVLRPAERAIVRVSGPAAVACVSAVFEPRHEPAYRAAGVSPGVGERSSRPAPGAGLQDPVATVWRTPGWHPGSVRLKLAGELTDVDAYVLVFRAPRSYTGEDLVELHLPGAPILVDALLAALRSAGVVGAEPGEFTRRAVLNGRMQVTEAEATLVAIHATDAADLRVGARLLGGETQATLDRLRGLLTDLLADVEAGLDFSGEDIEIISDAELAERLTHLAAAMARERALLDPRQTQSGGRRELNGLLPRVALIGPTGAGKSTLFNRLLAQPAGSPGGSRHHALTAARPTDTHTTRDVLTQELQFANDGVRAVLGDLPGAGVTDVEQTLEREAIAAGLRFARSADVLVFVADGSTPFDAPAQNAWQTLFTEARLAADPRPAAWIWNKADLTSGALANRHGGAASRAALPEAIALPEGTPVFALSAASGAGCVEFTQWLESALAKVASPTQAIGDLLEHLGRADQAVTRAVIAVPEGQELAALAIREALRELEHTLHLRLTPDQRTEAMLDRLFARFCLGK